ncbi:hypothetical protein SAMD00019534_019670, partial [Acytostelium subglobosum LB1]|uniref:hypothetical protein n=1 Tax=Acytostelium subglobosum LB1 TaxID=1410327 RepID=UPI000644F3F6
MFVMFVNGRSSSCIWSIILASSFLSISCFSILIMANLMISAAVPCGTVFLAFLFALSRSSSLNTALKFLLLSV